MVVLDFELVMDSEIPFHHFYEFISKNKTNHKVYLDLYVLIKLYENRGREIMRDDGSISYKNGINELEKMKLKIIDLIY